MQDDALIAELGRSRELGFLGPGPVGAQLEHAREFVRAVGTPTLWLDLGSGGGLPGLVLAHDVPGVQGTLLDAMQKRCAFLESALQRLGLHERVRVACGRAEELARHPEHRHMYDLVVARSFGPPSVTAECAAGFIAVGGHVVISEPPNDADRWPANGLAQLGLTAEGTRHGANARFVVLRAETACDERFPRRVGVPAKRPLF